jgi:hypothetical protein
MIAWWSFDEQSGTIAEDRLGEHHGAYSGDPTPILEGVVRGALDFDGSGDYVAVPDSDDWAFGSQDFTIEFWASFDNPGGTIGEPHDIPVGHSQGPYNQPKWLISVTATQIAFHVNGPGIGGHFSPIVTLEPGVVPEAWYHIAVVRSGQLITIFVDGVPAASAEQSYVIPNPDAPLTIGQAEQIGFMDGRVDELSIYHRALTHNEIEAIFDAGAAGKCIDLLSIHPDHGGNTGPVTVQIEGVGFAPEATVWLQANGLPDIQGDPVLINEAGTRITTTFDLFGHNQGTRDVVIGDDEQTLEGGFTVEEGGSAEQTIDLVGLGLIRPGRPQTYHTFFGNNGTIDAAAVPLWVAMPADADLGLPTPLALPSEEWEDIAPTIEADDETLMPVLLSKIPPQHTGTLPLSINVPDFDPFVLRAWINPPLSTETRDACMSSVIERAADLLLDPDPSDACINGIVAFFEQWAITASSPSNIAVYSLAHGIGQAIRDGFALPVCGSQSLPTDQIAAAVRTALDELRGELVCLAVLGEHNPVVLEVFPVGSFDPNDKLGSIGVGEAHYIPAGETLPYLIRFENLESATAPAQEVIVTDVLDADTLDLGTVSLGPISFGPHIVVPPPGSSSYAFDYDLRPEENLIVRITVTLNPQTAELVWRFTSIDPDTGQLPIDPLVGFLPPNVNPPEGEGSAVLIIDPHDDLGTDTQIANGASIVFDLNEPIVTPTWVNTIDDTAPSSHVLALDPVQQDPEFLVEWTGDDEGSGVAAYDVFVSEDGGPFVAWQESTVDTSAMFTGEQGSQYAFYSIAEDGVGHREDEPTAADTETVVGVPCPADLDGNGTVDVTDLLALLANWGGAGDGDINDDGVVDVEDLLLLLAAWGPCE